jgi:hypothetical protein
MSPDLSWRLMPADTISFFGLDVARNGYRPADADRNGNLTAGGTEFDLPGTGTGTGRVVAACAAS